MQSKSAIQVFAVALVLVCIYQLSFTWVTQSVEQDAKDWSNGDAVAEQQYLDSMATEPVYNILVKQYTYKECKDREINLGLDLKGGMNVTLEVSVIEVIKSMANKALIRLSRWRSTLLLLCKGIVMRTLSLYLARLFRA